MPNDDRINKEIVNFKKTISEIDDHSEDSEFFYKLSLMTDCIARCIEQTHCGYYVAFVDYGAGDVNSNDKIYYPIGFMTAGNARKILSEELLCHTISFDDADIFEVSKETFKKYYALKHIVRVYNLIATPGSTYLDDIFSNECIEKLKEKIDQLRQELGLKYRWERVESIH